MSPSNFIQIAAVTLGFIGGAKGGAIMYDKLFSGSSALAKVRRFAGLATFAIATFAATKIKNPTLKVATSGVAAAGIYDLIAQNFAAAGLKPVSGDVIDLEGVDLVGEGDVYAGDSVDVSGDMTELVGDDSDRIYG